MLDLVKTVRDIGENSSQIGKIIKTIEAIVQRRRPKAHGLGRCR